MQRTAGRNQNESGESGSKVVSIVGDATQEETAKECVHAAVKTFGTLDILINNVGVGNYKDLIDTSAEEYDEMMDTNFRSTFLFTRHTDPVMIKQGSGTIMMISSMVGVYGFVGEAVYSATKFAQVGFAEPLDKELQPKGIRVGVICPGGVKTEFAIGKCRTEENVASSGSLRSGRCCWGCRSGLKFEPTQFVDH